MQTLNHLVLAPKHKLSLVQVGNERLLLSVSPEGISLITQLTEGKIEHASTTIADISRFNDVCP